MRGAANVLAVGLLLASIASCAPAPRVASGERATEPSRERSERTMVRHPTAFYYGPELPRALLERYERIVVEPERTGLPAATPSPEDASLRRAELFAYVSLGEVHPSRPWRAELPPGVVLGTNAAWGSLIVDAASPAWRAFVLDRVLEPLVAKGYRGFFFDTLDSHELVVTGEAARAAQVAGLAAIVEGLKERHPDTKILLNRGFAMLPRVARLVDAVVAESLLEGHEGGGYARVPAASTEWLLAKLREVESKWRLPVIVIDYVDPNDAARRIATAKRILALGFEPWVTSPALDEVGVGSPDL